MAHCRGRAKDWFIDLTEKERRFVEEYMVDLNGTKAMMRCGIEDRANASSMASYMRRKKEVRDAIDKLFALRGISKVRIIEEYAKIAFANIGDFVKIEKDDRGRASMKIVPHSELSRSQLAALSEISEVKNDDGTVSIKVKTADKLGALTYLGKACSLFVERQEISGPDGGPIEINQHESKDRLRSLLGLNPEGGKDEAKSALPKPDTASE